MFKHFTRRKNAKYHFILSISFIVIISLVVAMVTFFSSSPSPSSSSSCSLSERKSKEGFDLGIFSATSSNSGSTGRDDSDSSSDDDDYSLSPSPSSSSSQKSAANTFYFFSASWCPHCTSAKGAWSDLLAKCDASGSYTTTSAAKVLCSNVDCSDVDPNSRTNQLMQIYNVQFFPKFILDASGKVYTYSAPSGGGGITADSFTAFLNASLKSN